MNLVSEFWSGAGRYYQKNNKTGHVDCRRKTVIWYRGKRSPYLPYYKAAQWLRCQVEQEEQSARPDIFGG